MNSSAFLALWRLVRSAAITAGVLLSVVAVVELLRVYVTLRDVSPSLGAAFALLIVGGIAWVVVRFLAALWSLPQAPAPPEVADPTRLSSSEALACAGFLQHRIRQLRANMQFSSPSRESLDSILGRLREAADQKAIFQSQAEMNRILEPLDSAAERIVQECVRDVMVAVVLSPYRSADLLVVLYRNGQMVRRLAQLYQTRPAPIEELRILRDVAAIVATVNFLNFTEKFIEQLLERVPGLGQLAGDLTQGIGAGLLTSAAGHAAIQRCKSIEPWSRQCAQEQLAHRMSGFATDVKDIFKAEVLPRLRPRVPDFAALTDRLSVAFDAAVDGMGNWVWRPVTTRGSRFAAATIRGSASAWRGMRTGSQGIGKRSKLLFERGRARLSLPLRGSSREKNEAG